MKKFIYANFIIGSLLILIGLPSDTIRYARAEDVPVKPVIHHKKVNYEQPEGKVAEIAELVARETGIEKETIDKIMWAESGYDPDAKHINKNKSVDRGLFQINSQHIPLAQSMGMDITTPEGNAQFAIYLMKLNGLRDWGYSKPTWSSI